MAPNHHKLFFRFLFTILLLTCQYTSAQQSDAKNIISHYDSISNAIPREKLYVHFDKSIYLPTDTIWFKGYLVEAGLHTYSNVSGLIHFDMVNTKGEVVQSFSMPTLLGLTWGGLAINELLYPPGNYTFRAYTNWMINFDDVFVFKKEITILNTNSIGNTNTSIIKNNTLKNNSSTSRIKNELTYDIQFLPEGGNWLVGKQQKMAVKALDKSGNGIKINGSILDSRNNKIIDFESNDKGMGHFFMIPKANEIYNAQLNKSSDSIATVVLPKVSLKGLSLQVSNPYLSDSLTITVNAQLPSPEIIMIGQSRGLIRFVNILNPNTIRKTIKVAKNIFPAGVSQIILMDAQKRILNERSFFLSPQKEFNIQTNLTKEVYKSKENIPVQIKATDGAGKPIEGSFSIAITDDSQVFKDSLNAPNIISYFLLNSDLKGEIETPGYYFSSYDEKKHDALDALMLTQGWVSYDWDLKNKPQYEVEKEFKITGTVTNIMNRGVKDSEVILTATNNSSVVMNAKTDSLGTFSFLDLPVLENTSFIIQALNSNNRKGTLGIKINEYKSAPVLITNTTKIVNDIEINDSTSLNMVKKAADLSNYLNDGINLKQVEVIGNRTVKGSKNLNGPGNADEILTEQDMLKAGSKTLLTILEENIKGFGVKYNNRGPSVRSFNGVTIRRVDNNNLKQFSIYDQDVKIIIDGVNVDLFYTSSGQFPPPDEYYNFLRRYLVSYTAEDVNGIEIMRSNGKVTNYKASFIKTFAEAKAQAEALLGHAYIEITTKKGIGPYFDKQTNLYHYGPLSYGNNKVFYSPKYMTDSKEDKKLDLRSTIYWEPNLTTNKNGEANFSFFSSDSKGSYTMWIEGTDTQGNFGAKTMKIIIK